MSERSVLPEEETAATPRPVTITAAYWLWIIETVLSLATGVLGIMTATSLPAITRLAGDARVGATAGIVIVALGVVLFAMLRFYFVVKMSQGRGWARIVLTVLGALAVLTTVFAPATGGWIGAVATVLVVAALVAMYLPESNRYFRETKAAATA